jgi:hypothetical protein
MKKFRHISPLLSNAKNKIKINFTKNTQNDDKNLDPTNKP